MTSDTKMLIPTKTERKQRGRVDRTVMFPVAPPKIELPQGYSDWLTELKQMIETERLRIVIASNTGMIILYWDIGRRILEKQQAQGWVQKLLIACLLICANNSPNEGLFSA